jgi:hypothetical protein
MVVTNTSFTPKSSPSYLGGVEKGEDLDLLLAVDDETVLPGFHRVGGAAIIGVVFEKEGVDFYVTQVVDHHHLHRVSGCLYMAALSA